jgi:hypothetical protein
VPRRQLATLVEAHAAGPLSGTRHGVECGAVRVCRAGPARPVPGRVAVQVVGGLGRHLDADVLHLGGLPVRALERPCQLHRDRPVTRPAPPFHRPSCTSVRAAPSSRTRRGSTSTGDKQIPISTFTGSWRLVRGSVGDGPCRFWSGSGRTAGTSSVPPVRGRGSALTRALVNDHLDLALTRVPYRPAERVTVIRARQTARYRLRDTGLILTRSADCVSREVAENHYGGRVFRRLAGGVVVGGGP